MSKFVDRQYLKMDQYRDSTNLDARAAIHRRFSTNSCGWFKWVFDRLMKLPEDARILELGSGHGLLWKENIDRVPPGWHITLSDISSGMLDAAWRNLVITGRAFKFEEIDAQSIPYEGETFDAVIANHMLYHVPDRPKAITEIRRVLKSGSQLIATTVGEGHMKEMMAWMRRVSGVEYASQAVQAFTLENGLEQLKPFFHKVSVSCYEDALRVTQLDPILAYIRSGIAYSDLREAEFEKLKQELQAELDEKTEIFISKESGLFEAIK